MVVKMNFCPSLHSDLDLQMREHSYIAQQKVVHHVAPFNTLLTNGNNRYRIIKISFSKKGSWNKFHMSIASMSR